MPPKFKELTHYAADDLIGHVFGKYIESTDKTLQDNSTEGIALYTNMLRLDAHLAFCFRKRSSAVLSLEWKILPGGETPKHEEHAEFVQGVFDRLEEQGGFATSRKNMFAAQAYGYQPVEILYELLDNRIVIKGFRNRDPNRFRFNKEDELVYISQWGTEGVVCEPWKFMRNTWGSDETPYGKGLLRELYPLWFFKANGLKDFSRWVEKMGTGWIIGRYPPGTQNDELDQYLAMLEKMQATNVAMIPDGSEVDFQQPNHTGVMQLFEFIIEKYVDKKYTLAILEQTTSTETESGTFALARFHSKGEQRVVEEDSKWQQAQINQPIKFIIDVNYGTLPRGEYPRFQYQYEEHKDLKALGEALQSLVKVNIPITVKNALEMGNLPVPEGLDEDELLKIKQAPSPFGGGFGNSAPGEEESKDKDQANGLSEYHLASKKKDRIAHRQQVIEGYIQNALRAAEEVYRRWVKDQQVQIKKMRSLFELRNIWTPKTPQYLIRHYQEVLLTANLLSRALRWEDIRERGFLKWASQRDIDIGVELSIIELGGQSELISLADVSGTTEPMSPSKAWAIFKDKIPMGREEFLSQSEHWYGKAFSIAHLENKYVVKKVQDSAAKALDGGMLFREFAEEVNEIYDTAGLTAANKYHLETVYRTNIQSVVNAARYKELQQDSPALREFFPDLQYVTAGDDAVRDEHAELDGLVFPRDHEFWSQYYPPNGFNCRCIVEEMSVLDDYESRTALPEGIIKPESGWDRPPIELAEDPELVFELIGG